MRYPLASSVEVIKSRRQPKVEWFNLSVYKYGPVFENGLLARNGILLWRSRESDKL